MNNRAQGFELLGQKLVLWLDDSGRAIVASDRCCHRSAQLSKGKYLGENTEFLPSEFFNTSSDPNKGLFSATQSLTAELDLRSPIFFDI